MYDIQVGKNVNMVISDRCIYNSKTNNMERQCFSEYNRASFSPTKAELIPSYLLFYESTKYPALFIKYIK